MHFDLTSSSPADQAASVELALRLGGHHVDVGQRGDEGHVVLGDPEDNEFCVIESGNNFLANTARIGGMAGDGMPATGYFWGSVLGWPLVWDQDEETAIQSPAGGVKITWGGPPGNRSATDRAVGASKASSSSLRREEPTGIVAVRGQSAGRDVDRWSTSRPLG